MPWSGVVSSTVLYLVCASACCGVVAYGKVVCYDGVRCYEAHCYEPRPLCNYLVGAGGWGGIRPSHNQHSPSKTTSGYSVIWDGIIVWSEMAKYGIL